MTERLSSLLHSEADAELVPVVDPEAILGRARGLRRRRHLGTAAVAIVVAGAVLAAGLVLRPDAASDAQQRYASATAGDAYRDYGAFSVGPTVYLGNHQVTFEDKVKSLYYTSLGVVVRHGPSDSADNSGPSHYELIRPDGTHADLDLDLGDRIPGTSPNSPYFTYATPVNNQPGSPKWDLVAVDLRTGEEVANHVITNAFTWAGWAAPPVTTEGTAMWALVDDGWVEYDWATGTTRLIPAKAESFDAAGSRYVVRSIVDDTTDEIWHLHSFTGPGTTDERFDIARETGWLSPDGRIFRLDQDGKGRTRLTNLDTSTSVTVPGRTWGWTPDGDVFAVDPGADTMTVCSSTTGRCDTIHRDIRDGSKVRLGGALYES